MKKLLLLGTVLLGIMLTGCGTNETEAKANGVETVLEETVTEETVIEEEIIIEETVVETKYTVNEAKAEMYELMSDVLSDREYYGWSDKMVDDFIAICESVKYDESFEYGFDFTQWQLDVVNAFINNGHLPEVCRGMTLEDIELIYDAYDELL